MEQSRRYINGIPLTEIAADGQTEYVAGDADKVMKLPELSEDILQHYSLTSIGWYRIKVGRTWLKVGVCLGFTGVEVSVCSSCRSQDEVEDTILRDPNYRDPNSQGLSLEAIRESIRSGVYWQAKKEDHGEIRRLADGVAAIRHQMAYDSAFMAHDSAFMPNPAETNTER